MFQDLGNTQLVVLGQEEDLDLLTLEVLLLSSNDILCMQSVKNETSLLKK